MTALNRNNKKVQQKVANARICMEDINKKAGSQDGQDSALQPNNTTDNVFDRLSRPKSTRSRESRTHRGISIPDMQKQKSQNICSKNKEEGAISNRPDATSSRRPGATRPATQLVSDLYNDYFARNKKKEQIQQDNILNR